MPRLDGRVVITERIAEDFAPAKHFLHVDGALGAEVLGRLPPLEDGEEVPKEFTLFFAGRLWEANGVRVILRAFSLLGDPGLRLFIAGQGPLKDLVVEAAARDPRIRYLGFLGMDEVMKLYGEVDVLLNIRLTSRVQTPYLFPSKLLEYYATGKIVITTPVAHAEREYGHFGFVLREETPEALARLIESVRAQPPRKRLEMGRAARRYMLAEKTWARQGERIARYLEGICAVTTS
jgi:glycosyltransferase involved in cell wall biosynthesis